MTTCQICGAEVGDDDHIVLEGRRICTGCKPLVLQQIMEGGRTALPTSEPIELADHEFRFWELLQKSWAICRQDWPVILGLKILVSVPSALWVMFYSVNKMAGMRPAMPFWNWPELVDSMIVLLGVLGVAWVVEARARGYSLSFGEALGKAVRRWLPAIGTNLLMWLILGILFVLLIVPGIIFAFYFSFAIYATALRGCAGSRALEYSKNLVNGRWWRAAGKLLGVSLLPLALVVMMIVVAPHLPHGWFVGIVRSFIVRVLYAFIQVATALLFLNLDALERKTPGNATMPKSQPLDPGSAVEMTNEKRTDQHLHYPRTESSFE